MKQLLNFPNPTSKNNQKLPRSWLILGTRLNKNYQLLFWNFALIIIGAVVTSSISASPACYMIDASGQKINLSSLCGTSRSSQTAPLPAKPFPTEQNREQQESSNNQEDKSANPTVDSNSEPKQEEVNPADLPIIQKTIPLIRRQRSPETED